MKISTTKKHMERKVCLRNRSNLEPCDCDLEPAASASDPPLLRNAQ